MKNKFMLSLLAILTITLVSFTYKSLADEFTLTNDTEHDIVALAIYPHDSDDEHDVDLEGDALKVGETETFTTDVEGDYDVVGLDTEGEYVEFDFTDDEGDLNKNKHKVKLDKAHQKPVHHDKKPKKK